MSSRDFQSEQAARIGRFLTRLAEDDALLLRYIKNRAAVLGEVGDDELTLEDKALLLEGDYCRVSEVMRQGDESLRFIWINIWMF